MQSTTNPTTIATIVGARPQFVKAAVVSRAITRFKEPRLTSNTNERSQRTFAETIIHTGQHFDENMSDVFFEEMDIPTPHHNLGVGGGSHGQNTGRMIEAIENILQTERPDWVLNHDYRDSRMAGSLARIRLRNPVTTKDAESQISPRQPFSTSNDF